MAILLNLGNNSLISQVISFIRFPLIVLVVLIHAHFNEIKIGSEIISTSGYVAYDTITFLISGVICKIAVPIFYILSGFLFFYKIENFDLLIYKKKLSKRIRTILIPYLSWNLIVIGIYYLSQTFMPELNSGNMILISDFNFKDWICAFWSLPWLSNNPICYQFWFVRDLIVVFIFTPIIWILIRYIRILYIVIIGVVWFMDMNYISIPGFSIASFFFFSVGAFFSSNNFILTITKTARYIYIYISIVYILAALLALQFRNETFNVYFVNLSILLGIPLALAICTFGLAKYKWKTNKFISSSTFFIYGFHGMVLVLIIKVLLRLVPLNSFFLTFIYIVAPTITILTGLGIYYLLKKYLPNIVNILTGSR